ncbi:MAG: AAA family ATPase [Pseudomonadota bacterium]
MRIQQLLIAAYGPFSDCVLDWRGAPLQIVFGANEAGKSSALRALGDWRFGFPRRTSDNFRHPNNQLQIAARCVTATNESVLLVRYKRDRESLWATPPAPPDGAGTDVHQQHLRADGAASVGSLTPAPHLEAELAAGLTRREYESMFGLDHQRLRAGGEALMRGEGELGSALFAASAGTVSVQHVLAELEQAAGQWFKPRATTAPVNVARKGYLDSRRRVREVEVKPGQWRALKQSHTQAAEQLVEAEKDLEEVRGRHVEASLLRSLAPSLQRFDDVRDRIAALGGLPELANDAAERRVGAETELAQARAAIARADEELAGLHDLLRDLTVDENMLAAAAPVDRLKAQLDGIAREREALATQSAQLEACRAEARELLARMTDPSGAALSAFPKPSQTDERALLEKLDAISAAEPELHSLANREKQLQRTLQSILAETAAVPLPPATAWPALKTALRNAASLDVERTRTLTAQLDERRLQQQRALTKLGVDDLATLTAARPLSAARIEQETERRRQRRGAKQQQRADADRITDEISNVTAELSSLEAVGEVPTLQAVHDARRSRDAAWAALRSNWSHAVDEPARPETDPPLSFDDRTGIVDTYEAAVNHADRQADRLREDSARAAAHAHARTRFEHLNGQHAGVLQRLGQLEAERDAEQDAWMQRLADAALPAIPEPELLRDWQHLRDEALSLADALAALQTERAELLKRETSAAQQLVSALNDCGHRGADGTVDELVTLANSVDQQLSEAEIKAATQAQHRAAAERDLATLRLERESTAAELNQHRQAIAWQCNQLGVDPGAPVSVIQARLRECERGEILRSRAAELDTSIQMSATLLSAFDRDAADLAGLVSDALSVRPEDIVTTLSGRLASARDKAQRRAEAERLGVRLNRERETAAELEESARSTLAGLCEAAGVSAPTALPALELRVAEKQRLETELAQLDRQLRAGWSDDIASLRKRLDGRSVAALDTEIDVIDTQVEAGKQAAEQARRSEELARRELEKVDTSDRAAAARADAEHAAASLSRGAERWMRLRLAHALLGEAGKRFRERAQGPMMSSAGRLFERMTNGRYCRLHADGSGAETSLVAERTDRRRVPVGAMSEGTADQLYLSLRLAALSLKSGAHDGMPLVLDDILITSDDERAHAMLRALSEFAAERQVLLFTHHAHLLELAAEALPADAFNVQTLPPPFFD